jgi:hypothetical protein
VDGGRWWGVVLWCRIDPQSRPEQQNISAVRAGTDRTSWSEHQTGTQNFCVHDTSVANQSLIILHRLRSTPWPTSNQKEERSSPCAIGEVRYITAQLPHVPAVLIHHPENSVPPTLLATLITAQHARPFQALPMAFAPVLLFSSYLNLSGYKTDAAGTTAAWSGLYALLAMRRRQVCNLEPLCGFFRHALQENTLRPCCSNSSRSLPYEALSVEHRLVFAPST